MGNNTFQMRILVTGAKGFVGRNLCAQLRNILEGKARGTRLQVEEVMEYDLDTPAECLREWCQRADFVFNLAGVNRPKDPAEFMKGNFGFASTLLSTLKDCRNTCPVMLSSSTQAALDNPYGESKRKGEELFSQYGTETGARVVVYRFPNLFGKWCRPNYNSAVATFCNNIAHDLPITVNNRATELELVYIDDLVEEMLAALRGEEHRDPLTGLCSVPVSHKATLGWIADTLASFRRMPDTLAVPDLTPGGLEKKLYSTYLSYLPQERVAYQVKMNRDERGSFTELIRTRERGQMSVNISRPGITKGQHWHHTKNEKFIVVAGHGLIQQRREGGSEVMEWEVTGDPVTVVEMIPGCTHNIINLSDTENLVTLMWCNELFDPERPDTYYDPV